jgi:LAS superfamily LD-carboxypeptidase LdcB
VTGDGFDELALTGRARGHVRQYGTPRFAARPEVADAFLALRADAARAGIDLLPIASWRPLEAQVRNWNRKFAGEATLYDCAGAALDAAGLTLPGRVSAILNWTGLPGMTRRHWGTDIDVFDRAAHPPGYRPQLAPAEVGPNGVYARLHAWLDRNADRHGFYRPFRTCRGGMCAAPWHLSHVAAAGAAMAALDVGMVERAVRASGMLGRDLVLDMLPDLFARYALDVDPPL